VRASSSKEPSWAIITGASAGLGVAFAERAAADGYDVALVARRLDRLEKHGAEIAARFGVRALPIAQDLADPGAPVAILRAVQAQGGAIGALVNNAGYTIPKLYQNTTWAEQAAFAQVMALAPAHLCHLVLPLMLAARSGRIINVASIAAFSSGAAGHTLYPATKSFVVKLSQSLAAEARRANVFVSALCPGYVKTEFQAANQLDKVGDSAPRLFWQSPQAVVAETWRRNANGAEVIVPGAFNKIVATILKTIPEPWMAALVRPQAEKHRVD